MCAGEKAISLGRYLRRWLGRRKVYMASLQSVTIPIKSVIPKCIFKPGRPRHVAQMLLLWRSRWER